jgi:integrase
VFGSLLVSAVTETTIARWVKQMGGSGKTISNKHGFVSGAFNAAVRAGVMTPNPCIGRRLPHTRVEETVFLTPAAFELLRDHIQRERWKNHLATWLVTTGMRFSEATALSAADIDADAKTCRINKAWKYSAGDPVRAQEFFNGGWKPGRASAMRAGLTKEPRVHDLRHTFASWMIQARVPLPVIQQHLGHESIQTTIGVYGHLDRRSAQAAADAIGSALT